MYHRYKDRAAFLMVYIKEAHPKDGWQMRSNEDDDVLFAKASTIQDRQGVAQACCARLNLSMPCVVDTMTNTVDEKYAAWPERMFVIDRRGRIAYSGKQGPWGFKINEVKHALGRVLRGWEPERPAVLARSTTH